VVVPMISMAYLLYGIYVNHSIWYKLNDLTKFGIYITITGAAVTIIINLIFIPVYGYMASAWAHVVSYSTMIIMSFIFARKYYRIDYKMQKVIPYFILAIGMVMISGNAEYNSVIVELGINTGLILIFIGFAQYKDRLLSVLIKGDKQN
jgi:O-antigen/teichoic acid export membrane protein